MASASKIEWTEATWNPVIGCSRVSPGCQHCYAETMAARIVHMHGTASPYTDVVKRGPTGEPLPLWNGEVRFLPDRLTQPLKWRKPRRIFVNSMSDLFHEKLTNEQIAAVFGVMAACPQHTFQVLTKRAKRMRDWFAWVSEEDSPGDSVAEWLAFEGSAFGCEEQIRRMGGVWCPPQIGDEGRIELRGYYDDIRFPWPLPNVWLGVSAEDQQRADERISLLLECPAAVRMVSLEPLLGPVDLRHLQPGDPPTEINALSGTHGVLRPHRGECASLDWVIVGGESGRDARPCNVAHVRQIVRDCKTAGVACFVKQLGARPEQSPAEALRHRVGSDAARAVGRYPGAEREMLTPQPLGLRDRKGGDVTEWPEDLRVREWPA